MATLFGQSPWPTPHAPPSAPLPQSCEVLIVGAGVTGLSCALALATEGRDVVVVDRRFGSGAVTRSGGIIVGDTLIGPAAGFEKCDLDLRTWVEAHAPACAMRWDGCLELDRNPSLSSTPIDWQDAGPVRLSATIAGGTLDPAALVSALAWAAVESGARLCDGLSVDRCEPSGSRLRVSANDRFVSTDSVLYAVDATGDSAEAMTRWPQRQLTVALETAVIPDAVADEIGWGARLPFYTNELPLLWGRALDDGAMIAGRELIPMDESTSMEDAFSAASARLMGRIRGLHPALATIDVRRVWSGPIARDASGIPSVQRDPQVPDVWWAGGYGGHGLAQAFRIGRMAAVEISGRFATAR